MTTKLITADFGGNEWTVFDGSAVHNYSPEEFLKLNWCPNNTALVIEAAHIATPRTRKSLAQVFEASQLKLFYKRANSRGIDLRMFPHSQTPKARAQAGFLEKDDAVDAQALHFYIQQEPTVFQSLKRPPQSFSPELWREAGWTFKDEINIALNIARRFQYKTPGDVITEFIFNNLERLEAELSDNAKEIFGLYRQKNGSFYKSGPRSPQLSKLYSLAALLLDSSGSPRLRPDTQRPPGIKWLVRTQFASSPFHHRGGILRSNLYWHGFRNYAISKMNTRKAGESGKTLSHYDFSPAQTQQFRQLRKDYFLAHRQALAVMKNILAL